MVMAMAVNRAAGLNINRSVYGTVFSSTASLGQKPSPKLSREVETEAEKINIARQLKHDAWSVAGINNEAATLPSHDERPAFMPHFFSCSQLREIGVPSQSQRSQFLLQIRQRVTFQKLSFWIKRVGINAIQKVFATIIDRIMSDFVRWSYAGTYNDEVRDHLRYWVRHVLLEFINLFNATVTRGSIDINDLDLPDSTQIEQYEIIALGRLYALRSKELFDMVVDWDETVTGIDDLRTCLTTPQARQYVSDKFAYALETRLLHPGASTVEILQIYISTIRAFRKLDPRGVLLGKVSGRIRQYLREREDTVKVVVGGLLTDPSSANRGRKAENMDPDVLSELAWELQNHESDANSNCGGIDWNDMNWQPEPIDAADGPRSGRPMDVISNIINLFESKEIFVREVQVVLAERLLCLRENYDQEIAVLEHLKLRFGEAMLQACEVMLKDVLDSTRLDNVIRRDQGLEMEGDNTKHNADPELHAKILSRLFWPTLPGALTSYDDDENEFRPPLQILHQRNLYEQGFENLKQTRKLTWNDHVGQVDVELTFADGRTYADQVLPYQAGVLYAFHDDSESDSPVPISRSIAEISEEIGLSAGLTRSACLLFVSKHVLIADTAKADTFTVLEHLPRSDNVTAGLDVHSHRQTAPVSTKEDPGLQAQNDRAAELAAQQAAREAEAKEKRAKMAIYHQFVTAMLTNQGAMPLPRIAMMLGMVVPGGFPYSNEELREFLSGMVKDGQIDFAGNTYKKKG